jgi:site-specific recombinase XerD
MEHLPSDERRVYNAWLKSLSSENTRRAYNQAMNDLLNSCQSNSLVSITRESIDTWMSAMRGRGLSLPTASQRISAVSAFYRYAEQTYSSTFTGNPTTAARRPKVNPYGKSNYLAVDEVKALLSSIDRRTKQGRRDYALILGYIFTGRRNSEWRTLRWGDIQIKGDRIFYRWSGKGKTDVLAELPKPVWDAILSMLALDGRDRTIQHGEYLFCPFAPGPRRGSEAHWDTSKAVSARSMLTLVKHYCRKSGLNAEMVRVHVLRHSAAMLRKEAGDDIEKICAFLAQGNISVTQIYLHAVEGNQDNSWQTVAQMLCV